jgi:hypothetical protein
MASIRREAIIEASAMVARELIVDLDEDEGLACMRKTLGSHSGA